MVEVKGDPQSCIIRGERCAHLQGMARCGYLRSDIITIQRCPGPFITFDRLKALDFKTIIPLLADTDPMQKLNSQAIERDSQKPSVHDSPSYDKVPKRDFGMKGATTQIPPL